MANIKNKLVNKMRKKLASNTRYDSMPLPNTQVYADKDAYKERKNEEVSHFPSNS